MRRKYIPKVTSRTLLQRLTNIDDAADHRTKTWRPAPKQSSHDARHQTGRHERPWTTAEWWTMLTTFSSIIVVITIQCAEDNCFNTPSIDHLCCKIQPDLELTEHRCWLKHRVCTRLLTGASCMRDPDDHQMLMYIRSTTTDHWRESSKRMPLFSLNIIICRLHMTTGTMAHKRLSHATTYNTKGKNFRKLIHSLQQDANDARGSTINKNYAVWLDFIYLLRTFASGTHNNIIDAKSTAEAL